MVTSRTSHGARSSALAVASLLVVLPAAAAAEASTPTSVELSVGRQAMRAQPLRPASDIPLLPSQFEFVATYLPPPDIRVGGFLTLEDALTARDRAASLAEAARVALPPILPEVDAKVVLVGAGFAGAAAAVHPTLVARAQGAIVRLDPLVWPPGVMLQGVFF